MREEFLDQDVFADDTDEIDEEDFEDYEDEDVLMKGGQALKKVLGQEPRRKEEKPADPERAKKRNKNDAKNRYWRKHRDDVQW